MKLNKLHMTLGVFLLLLAYFLITQMGDRGFNTVRLPKIAAPAADDIQKIEIGRSGEQVVLERKDTQWLITSPLQFPADKNRLDNLRRMLSTLRVTDLISSRSGAETEYGLVTPTATNLKVATKSKTLELTVGHANRGATHTFVKLPKDGRVYQVLGDLTQALNTTAADWRSLQVNDFSPDNARAFTIVRKGKTVVSASKSEESQPQAASPQGVTAAAAPARIVWKAEGANAPLNDAKVSELLGHFCRLSAARISGLAPKPGKTVATVVVK